MITLFAADSRNFAGNGLMDIEPYCARCDVMEELNGSFTADIEIMPFPGMNSVHSDMVLRLPAPVRETPYMEVAGQEKAPGEVEKIIWKVNVTTDSSRKFTYIYSKPAWDYEYALKRLYNGTEYEYLGATSDRFHRAVAADGTTGYILTGDGEFSRNIESGNTEETEGYVVESKQTRDQLFRITRIVPATNGITVFARHITDDLRDNYTPRIDASNASGAALGEALMDNAMEAHPFNLFSDVDAVYTGAVGDCSPMAALIDADTGLTALIGGEVLRDNFDVYYAKAIGRDRGASIEYGKNAVQLEMQIDESDVCTRVIPVGYDENNEPVLLPEIYMDSPRANTWNRPRGTRKLDLREVKIGDTYTGKEALYAALREKAVEYFETGIDSPAVSAHAEYVDLSRTTAARNGPVSYVYLGDTVALRDVRYGYSVKAQVVAYVFDCLNRIYRSIDFGTPYASLTNIRWAAKNLTNGSISTEKLMPQSITGDRIASKTISVSKVTDDFGAGLELSSNTAVLLLAGKLNGANSHMVLTEEAIEMLGGIINIATDDLQIRGIADGSEIMSLDPEGLSVKRAAVTESLDAPNIVNKSTEQTVQWRGSIQATIEAMPEYLSKKQMLIVPAGTYEETIDISGFMGAPLHVQLSEGVKVNGAISISACQAEIRIFAASLGDAAVYTSTRSSSVVSVSGCQSVCIENVQLSGYRGRTTKDNGTSVVLSSIDSNIRLYSCSFEYSSLYCAVFERGSFDALDCVGGTDGGDPVSNANIGGAFCARFGAHGIVRGTEPVSTSGSEGSTGTLIKQSVSGSSGGMTDDPGNAVTRAYPISRHCTYLYGKRRIRDDQSVQFSQGKYGADDTLFTNWRIGAMWFAQAAGEMAGKTIVKATLTMRRSSGGWSNAVPVYLGTVHLAENDFESTFEPVFMPSAMYPVGMLSREEVAVYDVTDIVDGLRSGYALGVYEPVSEYLGAYSPGYTAFYGKGSGYDPVLSIEYK